MEDPFAVKELRIRQPARMMPGRARYDIFDSGKQLLAVVTETEPRSMLHSMADLVPRTRVLSVRSAAGEPVLTLVKRDNDWLTDLTDADDQLIGRIQTGETRRHYTLLDEARRRLGTVAAHLAALDQDLLTKTAHYTLTFTGPMRPRPRMMVAMVPVVLDMNKYGPY